MSDIEKARHAISRFLALNHDDLHADGARLSAFNRAHHTLCFGDIAGLIVAARTDPVAFDALAEVQDHYIHTGETAPVNLALAIRDIARGDMKRPAKRGRKTTGHMERDSVIFAAVCLAKNVYGLQRYDGGVGDSAAALVSEILQDHDVNLGADAVKKIIVRWGKN